MLYFVFDSDAFTTLFLVHTFFRHNEVILLVIRPRWLFAFAAWRHAQSAQRVAAIQLDALRYASLTTDYKHKKAGYGVLDPIIFLDHCPSILQPSHLICPIL